MGGRSVTNHDMKKGYWEGRRDAHDLERIWTMGKLLFRINPR